MDYGVLALDEEVSVFVAEVRALLDSVMTEEDRRTERRAGVGINRKVHRALGERGLLFPTLPPEQGGAGLDALRAALLGEELAAAGVPYQVVGANTLIFAVVRQFGSESVRDELLAGMAAGRIVATLGYTEPDCGSDAAAVRTRAVRDGDEWVITGQKMFTTGAQVADYSMVLARTDPDAPKRNGLTMFLVPLDAENVDVRSFGTMGGESSNMVFYEGVRVPDALRLGPVDEGWTRVASAALAAEHGMAGGGPALGLSTPYARVLDELVGCAVEWATAERANGTRPAQDPTVRRRIAEAALAAELSRAVDQPFVRISSSEYLIEAAEDLLDLVGAEGLVADADQPTPAGRIAEIHQFAQGTAIYGGTTDVQRNLIAEHLLGLPRHRGVVRPG